MKHTKRMFLIPEELYNALFNQGNDGTPIGMLRSHILNLTSGNRQMNADQREMLYNQEFKRFKKLLKEEEERPLNVRLQNIDELKNKPPIVEEFANVSKRKRKIKSKNTSKSESTKSDSAGNETLFETGSEREEIPTKFSHETATTSSSPTYSEMRVNALNAINKNLEKLNVNNSGQLIVNNVPIKTSNVSTIIDHILINKGVRRRPLPVGYDKFMERVNNIQVLKKF